MIAGDRGRGPALTGIWLGVWMKPCSIRTGGELAVMWRVASTLVGTEMGPQHSRGSRRLGWSSTGPATQLTLKTRRLSQTRRRSPTSLQGRSTASRALQERSPSRARHRSPASLQGRSPANRASRAHLQACRGGARAERYTGAQACRGGARTELQEPKIAGEELEPSATQEPSKPAKEEPANRHYDSNTDPESWRKTKDGAWASPHALYMRFYRQIRSDSP